MSAKPYEQRSAAEALTIAIKAIEGAPHNMGCHSIQPEFQNTPQWGTLEFCDCWKAEALEKADPEVKG